MGSPRGANASTSIFLAFHEAHFHEPLHQGVLASHFLDSDALSQGQLVERGHGRSLLAVDGADQNLRGIFPTQAEPALANLQQAWAARLQHPQPGADAPGPARPACLPSAARR